MRAGRGIVYTNGWYEWTCPKGNKQPWHIHRKDLSRCSFLRWPTSARSATMSADLIVKISSPKKKISVIVTDVGSVSELLAILAPQ
jgi:hypothetical protein